MSIDLNDFKLGSTEKPKQANIPMYGETADKVSEMRKYNISVNKAVESLILNELYPAFENAKAEGKIIVKAEK